MFTHIYPQKSHHLHAHNHQHHCEMWRVTFDIFAAWEVCGSPAAQFGRIFRSNLESLACRRFPAHRSTDGFIPGLLLYNLLQNNLASSQMGWCYLSNRKTPTLCIWVGVYDIKITKYWKPIYQRFWNYLQTYWCRWKKITNFTFSTASPLKLKDKSES